jgi:hypothetical protein
MNPKTKMLCMVGAIVAVTLLAAVAPVEACMTPCKFFCPEKPPIVASGLVPGGTTIVTQTAPDKARIEVGHYTTPQMSVTYACSVAFPKVKGIASIDDVALIATATGLPLTHYHWVPNDASVAQFQTLAKDDAGMAHADRISWQAFFSEVEGGSQGGIDHSFVFEVTLKPGTTLAQLLAGLRAQGVLANGSANFDGTLNFGHYFLRRIADGDMAMILPRPQATVHTPVGPEN